MKNPNQKPNQMIAVRGISESKWVFIFTGITLINLTAVLLYGVYIQTNFGHPLASADLFFDTMYSGVVVSLIGGFGGYALVCTAKRQAALKKRKTRQWQEIDH